MNEEVRASATHDSAGPDNTSRRRMLKWMAFAVVGAGVALLGSGSLSRTSTPGTSGSNTGSTNSTSLFSSSSAAVSPVTSTIVVKVMYFQMLQYVDTKQEYFVLQSPAQLGTLLYDVTSRHPSLAPWISSMIILVDGVAALASAPASTPLKDGSEVDLIPSIAGG